MHAYFLVLMSAIGIVSAQQNAASLPLQLVPVTTASVNGSCASAAMLDGIHHDFQRQVESLLRYSSRPPCACGGPGEWTRIAHLNMSDPSQQCPSNWNLTTTPVRGCGRSSFGLSSCDSATYPSAGRSYSRVCGQVNAYQ